MAENNDTFELRSEEVQDILTKVPHWMIRWGTVMIFAIIVILFFVSWFIKYPDVVNTEIIITTNIPPEKIVSKSSGRIEAILVKNKAIVSKNKTLAVIENTANYKDVFLLKSITDSYNINDPQAQFPFSKLKNTQLGEIESAYAVFQKDSFQILNNHAPIVSILEKGTVKITAPSFNFSKEVADKFTRVNDQTYTLEITSGTIEMKDNKIIVLVD